MSSRRQYATARRFGRTSPLFRWAQEQPFWPEPGAALVFGAGLLAEARALASIGWQVDALETPDSVKRRRELYEAFTNEAGQKIIIDLADAQPRYSLIVVTHVLEFVESQRIRERLLKDLAGRLAKAGVLLLSWRGWADVNACKKQTPRGDGIVTGLGTWTRGYTVEEAQVFILRAGLRVRATPNPNSKTPEQVRLVCQRT